MKKRTDILFEDVFKKLEITEQTRNSVSNHPERYTNCDVRVRMGKFYTDEGCQKYIEESLKRPLPGEDKGPRLIKKRRIVNKNSN